MFSVVMDTSNQYLVVGIYQDGHLLDSIQELGSKRQSENAIPYLERLLKAHDLSLRDAQEMIITKGPGSYIGVRVALTVAKTLAAISDVKIKTISSLAAYAGQQRCISVIDARSQKVFVGRYAHGAPLMEEQLMTLEEFAYFKADYAEYPIVGQAECVGFEMEPVDLCKNLYELGREAPIEENPDLLVPSYIKEVEAKKACY